MRDMQHAMRHADRRTPMRFDMAKANLDRHAAHAVAAYLAGMSTGLRPAPWVATNASALSSDPTRDYDGRGALSQHVASVESHGTGP